MEDIQKKKPLILNLSYERQIRLPLTRILKSAIFLLAVSFFIFGFVYAPIHNSSSLTFAAPDARAEAERKNLENQLAELEKQISDNEAIIVQYQKQGKTLKNEISALESKIAKLNLQIKAVNLNLEKLNQEITNTQSKINSVEDDIVFNKDALSQVLQNLYENEGQSLMEIFLSNPNLSDFFGNLNDLMLIQDNLRLTLEKVAQLRIELLDQKEQLAWEKADAEVLKNYRASQKQEIAKTQAQKNEILKITKGKESEYQKLVTETKKTAAEIRKQIFRLLGGGELDFGKAYELAEFAERATGVRAALILAILNQESAFGRNIGQCRIVDTKSGISAGINTGRQFSNGIHPTRDLPLFLQIVQEIGMDPFQSLISCPIDGIPGYGGAMGPTQFIPSTWNMYKNEVAKITGNNPPSPWNNADAFVATGIYLRDLLDSKTCRDYANTNSHLVNYQTLLERCVAAHYYAGGRWYTNRFVYGDPVVSQAQSFQRDIEILKAS